VYLASMEPLCPMKNTRKSWAIFPLDSAISNCVSKNALKTYGLQLNLGRSIFLISFVMVCVSASIQSHLQINRNIWIDVI
jgi:hypothetical protein